VLISLCVQVLQCPCDVHYLELFANAPGKVCLPVTILREQEGFFTVSLTFSFAPFKITDENGCRYILPPQYTGRKTFRGLVERSQMTELHAKVWVHRPGTYNLDGWVLESEVGDQQEDGSWKTRHRYSSQQNEQHQAADEVSCVTIRSISKCA